MARPADPHAREALVTAARAEFKKHGLQRARIEDITAACGLSKGAFYLHFPSKEALFESLVTAFEATMASTFEVRRADELSYLQPGSDFWTIDVERRLELLQSRGRVHDLAALEGLWSFRDVFYVLMSGAQGTKFEGVIWEMVDRERARVSEDCEALKLWHVVRDDLSPELLASVLVGTWVLFARQMSTMTAKPDFEPWLEQLSTLLAHGTRERGAPGQPASAKPAPVTRAAKNKLRDALARKATASVRVKTKGSQR